MSSASGWYNQQMRIVVAAKPGPVQPWLADAVAGLVRQTGASVTVVAADDVELERLAGSPRAVFAERALQAVTAMAAQLAEAGIDAATAVLPGRAVPAVIDYAAAHRADLIVAGSSTRPAVAERLLGSVPLDLIKKSPRPVLVVTHPG